MLTKTDTLKSIFMRSPFGMLVTTTNGHIEGYNQVFSELIGVDESKLIGSNVSEILGIDSTKPHQFESFIERNINSVVDHCLQIGNVGYRLQVTIHSIGTNLGIESEFKELYCFYFLDWQAQTYAKLRKYFDTDLKELTANVPSVVFRSRYERSRPIDFISETIISLSGWKDEDFLSGKIQYSQLMSKEDEIRIWSAIGHALSSRSSYTVEYRITHKNGYPIWVSENGKVVSDNNNIPRWIVGVLTNNSDVKAQNAEFEGIVNALNRATAVVEFDIHGYVIRANKLFLDLFEYQEDEVLGHHHRMFCSREQHESDNYINFWNQLRNGEVDIGEYLRIGKNNKEVWIQATYNPIFDADGKPYKIMKFANDLSERRKMEKELIIAKEKAEEATIARGVFLANMSHEIRTPMNAIIGFTEQMLKTELSEQQEHFSSIVLNSSRSLLRLLNEILDMAKLEKGAVELEVRPFRFYDLIEQVISTYQVTSSEKGIKLILNKTANTPEYVYSDSLRIQQILLNLLSNAIKFTEKGSVTLDIDYQDQHMVMKVIDTGVGMKKTFLKELFTPFSQSDPSTKRQFGGTGLGTSISYQLIQLMQGTVDVDSELGKGSIFTVKLPMQISGADDIDDNQVQETFDIPKLNILIVDDTDTNLELLQITLESEGHTLTLARDGEQAIEIVKSSDQFDLVITDIQMPKVSGFELCEMIRSFEKNKQRKEVPVIALSANVLEEHRQLALKVGMNGFTHKPLIVIDLFREIARVIENSKVSTEENLKQLEEKINISEKHSRKLAKADLNLNNSESSNLSRNTVDENKAKIVPSQDKNISTTDKHNTDENLFVKFKNSHKEVKVVDEDSGLKVWKKHSIYIRAIRKFLNANKDIHELLIESLKNGDFESVSKEIHKLRGGSGNLSLEYLYKLSSKIETMIQKENLQIKEFIDEIPVAILKIETWLTDNPQSSVKLSSNSKEDNNSTTDSKKLEASNNNRASNKIHVNQALERIRIASNKNQLPSDTDMNIIKTRFSEKEYKELQDCIDNFNFIEILKIIEQVK